jgi:3-hydroxyacyl-CoA dehydrogenase
MERPTGTSDEAWRRFEALLKRTMDKGWLHRKTGRAAYSMEGVFREWCRQEAIMNERVSVTV